MTKFPSFKLRETKGIYRLLVDIEAAKDLKMNCGFEDGNGLMPSIDDFQLRNRTSTGLL